MSNVWCLVSGVEGRRREETLGGPAWVVASGGPPPSLLVPLYQ